MSAHDPRGVGPVGGATARCCATDPSNPRGAAGHARRGGAVDESARRLSHEELRVARAFADEGHSVRSLPERPGRGRSADLEVCGNPVEVKSWLPLADRHGVRPSRRSVVNKLISAEGQSPFVVLVANGSGLSAAEARSGLARYAAERPSSPVTAVRVMGDGFDLSWQRTPVLAAGRLRARGPDRGLAL